MSILRRAWHTTSAEETLKLGHELARELLPDGVLLLEGDLGAGKTVLAQGIGEGLGVPRSEIQSPTFTLIREHEGPCGRLIHVDLYRLAREEAGAIGLEELLSGSGVKVVEWAERMPFPVPDALRLLLRRRGSHERDIIELERETENDCTTPPSPG
jgi:tRNA threonylcarbamoyladenosine biosynthesis protein TsaE